MARTMNPVRQAKIRDWSEPYLTMKADIESGLIKVPGGTSGKDNDSVAEMRKELAALRAEVERMRAGMNVAPTEAVAEKKPRK